MNMQVSVKQGDLLLAEPFMLDPNFKRGAILLCEHDAEGSFGFVINRPLDIAIQDLVPDIKDFEAGVYLGGPVQNDTLHFLHNVGDLVEDSYRVCDGVYWGGNFEKLKFLIKHELILPHSIRFFVGYTGWSAHQLEEELSSGSWVTADMDANYLFKSPPQQIWQLVMGNKGNAYTVIAQMPDAQYEN